jgi:hypothetical protein
VVFPVRSKLKNKTKGQWRIEIVFSLGKFYRSVFVAETQRGASSILCLNN